MNSPFHPSLNPLVELAGLLEDAARETTLRLGTAYHRKFRRRVGGTLRPGDHTPMWNEVAALSASYLTQFGDKANLARFLEVPRQRVHDYLVAKTAFPDAERTLLLLGWLLRRRTIPWAPRRRKSGPLQPSVTESVTSTGRTAARIAPGTGTARSDREPVVRGTTRKGWKRRGSARRPED